MWTKALHTRLLVSAVIVFTAVVLSLLITQSSNRILGSEKAYSANNLIRLHVLAHDDHPEEQRLKLAVRDAITNATQALFAQAATAEEAKTLLMSHWPTIKETATAVVEKHGFDHAVTVEFGQFSFPPIAYSGVTVPGGDYHALRVLIGSGSGSNWWCVLFPPLCFSSVRAEQAFEETSVVQAGDEGVAFRFRLWEELTTSKQKQLLEDWWNRSIRMAQTLTLPLLGNR